MEPKRLLEARTQRMNLDVNLNKTQVVGALEAGFHCPECNVTLTDSISYIDHLNGRDRN